MQYFFETTGFSDLDHRKKKKYFKNMRWIHHKVYLLPSIWMRLLSTIRELTWKDVPVMNLSDIIREKIIERYFEIQLR